MLGGILKVGGDVSSSVLDFTPPLLLFGETGLLPSMRGLALGLSGNLSFKKGP